MGSVITGTGTSIPGSVVTNDDLARIMDTTDEWIASRTGVRTRHFAAPGVGSSGLAVSAARQAMLDAGRETVDMIVTATMTPDAFAPGIAATVQHELDIGSVGAFDIRQQCSGFLYGLELADAQLRSGKAESVLVVGAESHSGFLPFGEASWRRLAGAPDAAVSAEEYERNTSYRGWAVLFGDGAGAAVVERSDDPDVGFLSGCLHSDGSKFDLIHVPGIGFTRRPYIDEAQLQAELHMPSMRGRELFREAVHRMPESVAEASASAGIALADIDLIIAHQANARIVEAVRKALGFDEQRVPINIDRYGNTTAATLPILFDEMRRAGRVASGSLIAFTAFGAGAHWGASLYRSP